MSHRHFCDYAGHYWHCDRTALRGADTEPSLCMCFDHGVPMEDGNHSRCTIELLACPEHRLVQLRAMGLVSDPDNVPDYGGDVAAMKSRINVPPDHKLRRALRRASRRGFVGACVWCGHGYRQYNRKIEAAHLEDCAGYQKAERSPSNLEGNTEGL